MIEEVSRVHSHRDVVVEREVLAPFERLEAVDRDLVESGNVIELPGLDKQAMPPETRDVVRDGLGTAAQRTGDLAVAHASD
ncbi:MAG TPA: hypothetical protein VFH88_13185, partial [Candidatus Krumholzibacteria bacterium]|nr:hypothetical protein [Candidatus Krumholzibacteria bacterium]